MGADFVAYVEKKTDGIAYDTVDIYGMDEMPVTQQLWNNTPIDVIFGEGMRSEGIVPRRPLPSNCSEEVDNDWGIYADMDYSSIVTWFDYFELKALARTPEAELYNWDEIEEKHIAIDVIPKENWPKYNGLEDFVEKIDLLLRLNSIYPKEPGDIRIICCLSV